MSSTENDKDGKESKESTPTPAPDDVPPTEATTSDSEPRATPTLMKANSFNRIPPPTMPKPKSHPATSSSRSSTSDSTSSTSSGNPGSPKTGPKASDSVFSKASSPLRSTEGSLFSSMSPASSPSVSLKSTLTSSYKITTTTSMTSPASTEVPPPGPTRPPPPTLGPPAPPMQSPPGPPGPYRQFVNPEVPGYVGFANLPNQVHRKSVKKGFEFTLMVVGESGLGKSTLVNSLFLTDLYPERNVPGAKDKVEKTVKIEASTVEIEERGVKLRLTVVDTPGFADAINNDDSFKNVIKYVDDQFERYLQDESGLNRRHIMDNRVHCCFYFINPAGHGLKPLDVKFMKAVDHKVNIVPVIAKADTLTKQEVQRLKHKILKQIEHEGIQLYPLPDCDEDEDEDYKEQCRQLKEAVPFAVVGSSTVIEIRGRKVRGRMYPWGVVEVENPDHCDFIKLRTMLITHMQDLQEVTQEIHYENFRSEKLAGGTTPARKITSKTPRSRSENEREEKLTQKEKQLQEKEAEIKRMQEMLAKMQAEMGSKTTNNNAPPLPTTTPRSAGLASHTNGVHQINVPRPTVNGINGALTGKTPQAAGRRT